MTGLVIRTAKDTVFGKEHSSLVRNRGFTFTRPDQCSLGCSALLGAIDYFPNDYGC